MANGLPAGKPECQFTWPHNPNPQLSTTPLWHCVFLHFPSSISNSDGSLAFHTPPLYIRLPLNSLNGQYNIRVDYTLTQYTGIKAPLNQSLWQGPKDTEGTLTASVDGVWVSGSSGESSGASGSSAVKSKSGIKTVKKSRRGTTGKSGLKSSHHSRRALLWLGAGAAVNGEADIEEPVAASESVVHRRQLKKHKHRKSSSSSSSSSSVPIRSDVQLTSWTIGVAESDAAVALAKNIIASPALYFAQVQTIRYPNGAARCNFKSGLVNKFLNWLNKN